MALLSPTQGALMWLALAAALLLLFLLRRRSRRVLVPSLSPFLDTLPKRRNPLYRELLVLLLQLVGAALICAGLVGEHAGDEAGGEEGIPRIAVIDGSASMRAAGRMDAALRVAESMGAGVMLAAEEPRLLSEPGEPVPPLEALEAGWGRGSVARGVELARSLGAEPVVLSDRTGGEGWTVVGPGGADVAVEQLIASAGPGLPPEYALAARLRNHGDTPAEVTVRVETAEAVLGEQTLTLPPGEAVTRTWRMEPVEGAWVEARLVDHQDALPDNDRAFALLPGLRPAEVWLVSDGNRYVQDVLELLPGLRLRVVSPQAWRPPTAPIDLVIFDRVAPSRVPEGVATVWLDPPDGAGPLPPVRRLQEPVFSVWDYAHPLLRGVALRQLEVDAASVLQLREGARAVVASEEGPVVAVLEGRQRAVVIGFDLTRSDLPLTMAFPQLIYNLVRWSRVDAVGAPPMPATLSSEGISLGRGSIGRSGPAELRRLDASGAWSLPGGMAVVEGLAPGVYLLRDADEERLIAIELDPEEHGRGETGLDPAPLREEGVPAPERERPRFALLALLAAATLAIELGVALR